MIYEIGIFSFFFILGFVVGEHKYLLFNYWTDLAKFLDIRDELTIKRLKK